MRELYWHTPINRFSSLYFREVCYSLSVFCYVVGAAEYVASCLRILCILCIKMYRQCALVRFLWSALSSYNRVDVIWQKVTRYWNLNHFFSSFFCGNVCFFILYFLLLDMFQREAVTWCHIFPWQGQFPKNSTGNRKIIQIFRSSSCATPLLQCQRPSAKPKPPAVSV